MVLFLLPLSIYGRSIKVGVSHFDPPFVVQLGPHHFDGFDISMLHYICKKLDYECELIAYKRNRLLKAVESGEVDMAVSELAPYSPNRAVNVQFSIPYLINVYHIIGLKKLVKDKFDIELLNNKKIGITDEAYLQHIALLKLINPIVNLFKQDDELIEALNKGIIGFAFVDSYTASYWHINSSNQIVDYGSPVHFESGIAIAVNPEDRELLDRVNSALTSYRNSQDFIDDYNKYLLYF
jgi:ABC-type amino acid transport substrate-binding protein